MKSKLLDLIDFEKVNTLLEGFNKSTGFVTAILDLEGNVLSKSGWRQICTEFHRVHPETSKKCTISDTVLAGKLAEGEKYHFYECLNGLVDVAVPIIIKGEHIANLFSGQFFFEEPDPQFFIKQAREHNFDEKIYLKALFDVPVIAKQKVNAAMDFLLNMTQLISEMTFQKLEEQELNIALRKSEELYRSLFDNMLNGFAYCQMLFKHEKPVDFVYLKVNQAFENLTGFKNVEGKKVSELIPGILETDPVLIEIYGKVALSGESQTFEIYLESLKMWFSISAYCPQYEYFVVVFDVITDRKNAEKELQSLNTELEDRVKVRTSQLEAVNKELETFTYSVSHDLKAPLRGIDGYSKLLLDLHKENLNEEAQSFLTTIRSSTLRMNQLIEDLLEYSKLERSQIRNDKIKIRDLIFSITSLYNSELENGKYLLNTTIPDLTLIADEKGLSIAIRNLLENALKFSREKPTPVIEIAVEENETCWIIQVKDNGIGFDMKYKERIFEIFQRLHKAEDFPGTGIGLAMVNKAMQRMQGKVRTESVLGLGSAFYLEIPK